MSDFSSRSWRVLSPYLDQALEMGDEERTSWLKSLHERDPDLAAHLKSALDEHDALVRERFLEAPVPQPDALAVSGQSLGTYKLVSPIGHSGMGSVWLAERSDGQFERRAAVKLLNVAFAGQERTERFKREGKILGRLAHPHIAGLFDAGVSPDGHPYLVLEYVDGEHIDRYCDGRSLDVVSRIRLFLDVLDAVVHAHANLIVHRDLKPSNVMVRSDGQVKLLDFGIAKLLEQEEGSEPATLITQEGPLTPEFAAPEQITNEQVTTATDIYTLGILLYLLLSLEHPAGPGPHSPASLVKAVLEREPPRMSEVASRAAPDKLRDILRGDLDTIAAKALKKNPRERYPSVTAFADDLRRYLRHQPISARPDTFAYRTTRFIRRNRTTVVLAGLAIVAAIAGVIGTISQTRTARVQRDFAFRELSRSEAINGLNKFLLSDAAPSGKPFTVNELLARAEHIIERQYGRPDSRYVELLISIGDQYRTMDEDAIAHRVLDKAYRLSRELPQQSTRAKASCALAAIVAYRGEMPRAQTLIEEGLRELPDEPIFALDRISCLMHGGLVARERGAGQEAIERTSAALKLLQQLPFPSEVLELSILIDLAEAYRIASLHRDASAVFERAAALLASLGRDDTQTAGTLFNNWALALGELGQLREAERLFRRAIAVSSTGENGEGASPMLLVNHARNLHALGRFQEAATYAERGYERAKEAVNQVVIGQALRLRSSIYRDLGDLTRAERMVSELEPWWRRLYPEGHIALAVLKSEQSVNAQARGDLKRASNLADQAVADAEASIKAGRQGIDLLATFLVRRSGLLLTLRRPQPAASDARRALTIVQQTALPGTFSDAVGSALLALGRALQELGEREQARSALQSAAEHLHNSCGPDHPNTRIARELVDNLK